MLGATSGRLGLLPPVGGAASAVAFFAVAHVLCDQHFARLGPSHRIFHADVAMLLVPAVVFGGAGMATVVALRLGGLAGRALVAAALLLTATATTVSVLIANSYVHIAEQGLHIVGTGWRHLPTGVVPYRAIGSIRQIEVRHTKNGDRVRPYFVIDFRDGRRWRTRDGFLPGNLTADTPKIADIATRAGVGVERWYDETSRERPTCPFAAQ